jgi:pyruvate kinase
MAQTKIVATAGPATDPPRVLRDLLTAGVSVFRLNASHGAPEEHARRITAVRQACAETGRQAAVLLDLQGPKIRLGKFAGGEAELETGARFTITVEPVLGNADVASTTYPLFAQDVTPGSRILLADGAIELRAESTDGTAVTTEVVSGGTISDRKGINLPGVRVSAPSLTEKDLVDLEFGLRAGVDMVALSFVRTAADVQELQRRLKGTGIPVVAKIEKPQAWENIDSILEACDGAMVARGDLGVEMALERVPRIQKSIIRRARRAGRFVITATQMLESMVERSTPTRAEVSDVANAIYDGTDAVMLSAETSVGKHPVEAVRMMERIALETEHAIRARGFQDPTRGVSMNIADIVAESAYRAARDSGAAAIVVFTSSGSSARLISRYRPPVPVFAITHQDNVARKLAVNYGVIPILAPEVNSTDKMLAQMDRLLLAGGYVEGGQTVVFVAGQPIGRPGTTNLMKIQRVGEQ